MHTQRYIKNCASYYFSVKQMTESFKSVIMFISSGLTFLLQLLGFSWAFVISAALLAVSVYNYDLPGKIFEKHQQRKIEPLCFRLRLHTAVTCGLVVIGGALAIRLVLSLIMFIEQSEIPSSYWLWLEIFSIIILMLLPFIVYDKCILSLRKSTEVSIKMHVQIIDECVDGSGHFLCYSSFLGFGGGLFVTFFVHMLSGLHALFRLASALKSKKARRKITPIGIITELEQKKQDIWTTWLKADKSAVTYWLISILMPMSLLLTWNIGFMDYLNVKQMFFLALFLCPCITVYYGIKSVWTDPRKTIVPVAVLNFSFLFAFFEPSAMPLSALSMVSNPKFLVLMFCSGLNLSLLSAVFFVLSQNAIAGRHREPERALADFRKNAEKAEFTLMFAANLFFLGIVTTMFTLDDVFAWISFSLAMLFANKLMLEIGGRLDRAEEREYFKLPSIVKSWRSPFSKEIFQVLGIKFSVPIGVATAFAFLLLDEIFRAISLLSISFYVFFVAGPFAIAVLYATPLLRSLYRFCFSSNIKMHFNNTEEIRISLEHQLGWGIIAFLMGPQANVGSMSWKVMRNSIPSCVLYTIICLRRFDVPLEFGLFLLALCTWFITNLSFNGILATAGCLLERKARSNLKH